MQAICCFFNPRDNHYCAPVDGELLDYRGINIGPEAMSKAVREITGKRICAAFYTECRLSE